MGQNRQRGSGLATVMMVSALLIVVAFTVVGLGFNHLSVSNRLSNAAQAKDLAEAAVSKAIEEVLCDNTFGTAAYTGPHDTTVIVTFPNTSAANGVVTFKTVDAATYQIPLSTNNFGKDNIAAGSFGRTIPADAVHLLGVGRCNSVEKTIEAVVYVPKFPVMGCSGVIQTKGGMTATAVNAEADLADPSKHHKAKLAANGTGTSIKLEETGTAKNNVNADVVSTSLIDVTTSNVTGEIRPNSTKEPLPDIRIEDYDTASKPGLTNLVSDTGPSTAISGFTRFSGGGTRTITFDSLTLDKGVFYIDGNLQVNKGVSGTGALIVTGTTTIVGGGVLASDNKVALLSKGDISVSGDATYPAALKGLVYSKGSIDTNHAKVLGVVVANDAGPGTNHIEMNNTTYANIGTDETQTVSFVSGGSGSDADFRGVLFSKPLDPGASGYQSAAEVQTRVNQYDPAQPWKVGSPLADVTTDVTVPSLPGQPAVTMNLGLSFRKDVDPNVRFKSGGNYAINFYHPNPVDPAGNPMAPGSYRSVPDATAPLGYKLVPALPGVADATFADFQVELNGTVYDGNDPAWAAAAKADYLAKANALAVSQRGTPLTPAEQSACASLADAFLSPTGVGAPTLIAHNSGTASLALSQLVLANPGKNLINGTPATGGGTTVDWKISLSDFTGRAEQVRMLYWREL